MEMEAEIFVMEQRPGAGAGAFQVGAVAVELLHRSIYTNNAL